MGLDIYSRRITKGDGAGYFIVEDGFPEWTRGFERVMTEEYYDWDRYRDKSGFDIDEYDIYCLRGTDEGEVLELLPRGYDVRCETEDDLARLKSALVMVDMESVPLRRCEEMVLHYEEVGYQRKGMNSRFYDDMESGVIGEYVWDMETLLRYAELYCETEDMRESFMRNIVDGFVEGECVVYFSW